MAVPHGNMDVEEAEREVEAARLLFHELWELGSRAAEVAAKPPSARDSADKDRLVKYLILYRRAKALVVLQ